MSEVENGIVNELGKTIEEALPDNPIVEVAEAVVSTVLSPTPENILADIELAIKLVKQFKEDISGLHPTASNLLKTLIKEVTRK